MSGPLDGVRVVEVAQFAFVPSAGAVLGDWGADVIKIEHPTLPDPARRSIIAAQVGAIRGGGNFYFHMLNRGKRSVGVDLHTAGGQTVLERLLTDCDVFLTNVRPKARRRLKIDPEDIHAVDPKIVYARGSGYGVHGPEADRPGFDTTAFWARSGIAYTMGAQLGRIPMHLPAFGDSVSGAILAGGIAAALFRRERTGEGPVVDVSLLGAGLWGAGTEIAGAEALGKSSLPIYQHERPFNPLVAAYRCADGRFIQLAMVQTDRGWPELCEILERPDLAEDERFKGGPPRSEHSADLVPILQQIFAQRTGAEWADRLEDLEMVPWVLVRAPGEVRSDPQVAPNGYLQDVDVGEEQPIALVASPVQFDDCAPRIGAVGPEHGEHTEFILLEMGFEWDEIQVLKSEGAII